MKHLFIPYELALIAKEKGFNEDCLAYYQDEGNLVCCDTNQVKGEFIPYKEQRDDDSATAPLYQQIVDWFREKHNILISERLKWWTIYEIIDNGEHRLMSTETKDKAIEEAFKLI